MPTFAGITDRILMAEIIKDILGVLALHNRGTVSAEEALDEIDRTIRGPLGQALKEAIRP